MRREEARRGKGCYRAGQRRSLWWDDLEGHHGCSFSMGEFVWDGRRRCPEGAQGGARVGGSLSTGVDAKQRGQLEMAGWRAGSEPPQVDSLTWTGQGGAAAEGGVWGQS